MNKEIIFYQSLICPRCVRVRRLVRNIQDKYPDLIIRNIRSVTKVLKRDLHTLPAVQIGETILYGKEITEGRIINELGLI